MTDQEFLRYVEIHARTPRHAFSVEMAKRLLKLAGTDEITTDWCGIPDFVGIDQYEADRLVRLARKRT